MTWSAFVPKKTLESIFIVTSVVAARTGNRRFRLLSALRAHTKGPHKTDFHRKTRRALNRPRAARTGEEREVPDGHGLRACTVA